MGKPLHDTDTDVEYELIIVREDIEFDSQVRYNSQNISYALSDGSSKSPVSQTIKYSSNTKHHGYELLRERLDHLTTKYDYSIKETGSYTVFLIVHRHIQYVSVEGKSIEDRYKSEPSVVQLQIRV